MTNKIFKDIVENYQKGNFSEALKLCNETREDKNLHTIYNIKGAIHVKQNELIKAKSSFLKSIEINKNFLDPYKNLYLIYIKSNDLKSAINCSKKVIEIETKKNPISFFNLAYVYELNNNLKIAIEYYLISDELNFQDKANLYNNLGNCYLRLNKIDKSEQYFLKALSFNKRDKIINNNLLKCYLFSRNLNKSEAYYQIAKSIDDKYIEFKLNEAELMLLKNNIYDAIHLLEDLLKENIHNKTLHRLTTLYLRVNDNDKANKLLTEGLKKFPKDLQLKSLHGLMLLKNGKFEDGWNYYEFRKSISDEKYNDLETWKGEDLKDKKILVYSEQGIGDTIQFSFNLIELSKIVETVDFVVKDKVSPIFKKNYKNINILKDKEVKIDKYSFKISLGSLNKFFYKKNNNDYFNLFYIDDEKLKKWKDKININKKNIGLVWSGYFFGPKEPYRSIKLKSFKKLLNLDCNFYSLQKEIWDRDIEFFENSKIIKYGDNNLDDIVCIIKNLDLIISSDTSILHLSSVLEKKTWGLIPFDADWRWYEYYKIHPYQNLKIYKQKQFNNWDNVLLNLEKDLINFL